MSSNFVPEALIVAALRGDATGAELHQLQAWRATSPANEAAYRETARTWDALAAAKRSTPAIPAPEASTMVARAGIRPLAATPSDARPDGRKRRWAAAMVAAAAVLVVGVGLGTRWGSSRSEPSLAATEFATGPSETATVSLLDGTVVRLAPQSRLRIDVGSSTRRVSFEGRAFFAVAHDPTRPFEIQTTAGEVRVLGTRFDLHAEERDLQVAVVEGEVSLQSRGRETRVGRGEMGRVLRGVTVPAIRATVDTSTAWLGTFFAFQSTPLRDAAAEITRRSGLRIRIADPALSDHSVTGYFDERDPAVMMRVICAAVVADCSVRAGQVVVRRP